MSPELRKLLIELVRYPHDAVDPFVALDYQQLWAITHDLAAELLRDQVSVRDGRFAVFGQVQVVSDEQNAFLIEQFFPARTCKMVSRPTQSGDICRKPAIGTHEKTVRVCVDCATNLIHEGFEIVMDKQAMPRVGDRYRFAYENRDPADTELTVTRVLGVLPDDLVFFDDKTHCKQKHLEKVIKLP